MAIELNCISCGNNRFEFPTGDADPVQCQVCGDSFGSLGEVKEQVAKAVAQRLREQ